MKSSSGKKLLDSLGKGVSKCNKKDYKVQQADGLQSETTAGCKVRYLLDYEVL